MAKDSQLLMVPKYILFFAYHEISDIFTGQTQFLPVMAKGPVLYQ